MTFDQNNKIISNQTISDKLRVEIYSPQSLNITNVSVDATENPTEARLLGCGIAGSSSYTPAPWTNTPEDPMRCEFSDVKKSGAVRILAIDINGAEGQNTQSFIIEDVKPDLQLSPVEMFTGTDFMVYLT